MSRKDYAENLGPPTLRLAGLCIWVHGYQFPDAADDWDGNWLNITAHCGAQGAEVWISGPILHLSDLARWIEECERMKEPLTERANLSCTEPELSATLAMNKLGQIALTVAITPDHLRQEHRFEFEIDQSYLGAFIADCRRVLLEFPIKGDQEDATPAARGGA